MARFEEILKAQGFTDEEIAAQSNVDPKIRQAVEASYGNIESTLNSYKMENERWAQWHETDGKPLLAMYEKERADALAEAASLKERLRLAEEQGYAPRREEAAPASQPAIDNSGQFDPKKYKLVTQDELTRMADLEGRAIAMAADINEEYRRLTKGKSLIDYSTTFQDGRTLTGMTALREEAAMARKPLDAYVSEKFNFSGLRNAIADEQRKAAEEAIRQDERSKVIQQYGDPNVRPMMPSRDPFIPRPAGQESRMPWDIPHAERTRSRVERAVQTQLKGAVN
jgi:hypothetical protein